MVNVREKNKGVTGRRTSQSWRQANTQKSERVYRRRKHMSEPASAESFDRRVRLRIYRDIVSSGRVPLAGQIAARMKRPVREIRASFERLEAGHALTLENGTREILRAAPFWASPTGFQVESGRRSWWASCIWDALGAPAMLGRDARILTACGCCSEAMTLSVRRGKLERASGVIHFAVPARRWYEDIVFT